MSEAHHIITQQQLKLVARTHGLGLDLDRILYDQRNRLWVCRRHHGAHHSSAKPIPWRIVERHAPKVKQFARELGLEWWLERTYPRQENTP
jgi:hypothetical protein